LKTCFLIHACWSIKILTSNFQKTFHCHLFKHPATKPSENQSHQSLWQSLGWIMEPWKVALWMKTQLSRKLKKMKTFHHSYIVYLLEFSCFSREERIKSANTMTGKKWKPSIKNWFDFSETCFQMYDFFHYLDTYLIYILIS
jgi:hypothetical protein